MGGWDATAYVRRSQDELPMGDAPQQQQLPTSGVMGEVTPARGRGPSICRRGMYVLPLQVRASRRRLGRWQSSQFVVDAHAGQ